MHYGMYWINIGPEHSMYEKPICTYLLYVSSNLFRLSVFFQKWSWVLWHYYHLKMNIVLQALQLFYQRPLPFLGWLLEFAFRLPLLWKNCEIWIILVIWEYQKRYEKFFLFISEERISSITRHIDRHKYVPCNIIIFRIGFKSYLDITYHVPSGMINLSFLSHWILHWTFWDLLSRWCIITSNSTILPGEANLSIKLLMGACPKI